jgi:hypothetical protein
VITIDCHELSVDEQLALAGSISDGLGGKGLALVKDTFLMIDTIGEISVAQVEGLVRSFISKRKDSTYYSIEREGDSMLVRSPDPLARSRGRKDTGQLLPENLMKCPFCPFVTPYQEPYNVHLRSHLFGV